MDREPESGGRDAGPAGERKAKRPYRLSPEGLAALRAAAAARRPWLASTGPRTAAGKAASSLNALRHGLRTAEASRQRREVNRMLRTLRMLSAD